MTGSSAFGAYRLLRRIGAGGMAEVYLAKRIGARGFEKQLVIKRMLPHLSASERSTEQFLREARYAALIDHPNLVHVSDFGELDGRLYLAMEFVHGITVRELLNLLGNVSPAVACRVAMEVSAALHAIHTALDEDGEPLHLVHRDVTPRNVMVTADGGVKLLDFGIALPRELAPTSAMGTKRYMSPEHLAGLAQDHRSDLFALGVLIYEMVAGRPPFEEAPQGEPVRPDAMPEALFETVRSLLAIDPAARPASARAVQSVLELFVASQGLEGTRAHLGEVVTSILPAPSALRRLTHHTVTRILKLTSSMEAAAAADADPPAARARLAPALRFGGASLGFTLLVVAALLVLEQRPPEPVVIAQDTRAHAPTATAALEPAGKKTVALPSPPASGAGSRTASSAALTGDLAAARGIPVTSVRPEVSAGRGVAATQPDERDDPDEPREREPTKKRPGPPGTLTIDTQPWSEVYLDGKKLGLTPLEGVRLPSGRHEIELRNPSRRPRKVPVKIRAGKETRVKLSL